MYRKNILFLIGGLIGGLIIGFAVGAILVDEETTTITPPVESRDVENRSFFLVSFEDINTWLASTDMEMTDDQLAAMENVQGINDTEALTLYFSDTESEEFDVVNNVLSMVYNTLLAETNTEVDSGDAPPPFLVCLGILNDPYSTAPGLRVYVEIPVEVTDEMPKEWEENQLEGPMDENPLWSSECYDPSISESATPEPSATE